MRAEEAPSECSSVDTNWLAGCLKSVINSSTRHIAETLEEPTVFDPVGYSHLLIRLMGLSGCPDNSSNFLAHTAGVFWASEPVIKPTLAATSSCLSASGTSSSQAAVTAPARAAAVAVITST